MYKQQLAFIVYAQDKLGIVQKLSEVVLEEQGNLIECRLSKVFGQFAGIVRVEVEPCYQDSLIKRLLSLKQHGIDVKVKGEEELANSAQLNIAVFS